ncbi:unnamed protein product [Arctogadus glacialis]
MSPSAASEAALSTDGQAAAPCNAVTSTPSLPSSLSPSAHAKPSSSHLYSSAWLSILHIQCLVWANYEEKPVEEVVQMKEEKERVANYKAAYVTEISDSMHFYAQDVETGAQLESLMETMRAEIAAQPPVEGSYAPRRGDFCIATFADGEWYRARLEKVESPSKVHVFYIDYGNREVVSAVRLAAMPPAFSTRVLPAQATEYTFAFIQVPQDVSVLTPSLPHSLTHRCA